MGDDSTKDIPFEAYQGTEPYIFVSYSHKDKDEVYTEIKRLYDEGYRIWYDEGIPPASRWAEEIAKAIETCELFLVYLSSQAIKSEYIKDEIHLALEEDKKVVAIHLEEFDMPSELKLRLLPIQALVKYQDQDYYNKLTRELKKIGSKLKFKPGESKPKEHKPIIKPPPELKTSELFKTIRKLADVFKNRLPLLQLENRMNVSSGFLESTFIELINKNEIRASIDHRNSAQPRDYILILEQDWDVELEGCFKKLRTLHDELISLKTELENRIETVNDLYTLESVKSTQKGIPSLQTKADEWIEEWNTWIEQDRPEDQELNQKIQKAKKEVKNFTQNIGGQLETLEQKLEQRYAELEKLKPKELERLSEGMEWFEKANTLLKEENFFEANEALEQTVRAMPKFAEAWKLKGIALKNLGKEPQALRAFDKSISLNPKSVEAWINKGGVLIKLERHRKALSTLNRATQLEPKNIEALANKGLALSYLKRYKEALDAYNEALELGKKKDPLIWNAKGTVLFFMERYKEALECYEQAIKLKTDYEMARVNKKRTLEKLGMT
ncbi:MAG: tetratricopeptide repeat protein [Candidatus Hermodarchaeota archaeon]